MPDSPLLQVKDLTIKFKGKDQEFTAVNKINLSLKKGRTLAIVGESGSGKSVTALSLSRLLPAPPTCSVTGTIHYRDQNILALPEKKLRHIRGKEMAYIFQEPSTSLNPVFTIGSQIAEAIKLHRPDITDVTSEIIHVLDLVGIKDPDKRYLDYPHQLSGGMQQRVMIAMALACRPSILIADEPTTALDVTIQKQIIDLLKDLKSRLEMSIILITHNFGIISGFADDVLVMFRGNIVESGPTEQILRNPQHPYTKALIACIPRLGEKKDRLTTIDYDQIEPGSQPANPTPENISC